MFSDPGFLAEGLELPNETELESIRDQFGSPEEINDDQETVPSMRMNRKHP